jgi:hypothetical protein
MYKNNSFILPRIGIVGCAAICFVTLDETLPSGAFCRRWTATAAGRRVVGQVQVRGEKAMRRGMDNIGIDP